MPPLILRYGIAALLAGAALVIGRWFEPLVMTVPIAIFLCTIVASAWLGGIGPGLLATALLALIDAYYFESPDHSFTVGPGYIPRYLVFVALVLFVGWVSATQRNARQAIENSNAALRESEERWRTLFENVPVGVNMTGPHGRYIAANPAFQKMSGYTETELRNLSPGDVTHEDDRPATEALLAAHLGGGSGIGRFEKRYRRKDGGVVWADVSTFLMPFPGGKPILSGVQVDITERKRIEEELRRSEALLTEAQQMSHTGSWRWKIGTDDVRWSAECFRIFAVDPATTQLSFKLFMDRVHPEDRPLVEQVVGRAVHERRRFQYEYRILLPGGSVKHLQGVGQPDVSESGELEFVGTIMDITERRQAEEALRNAQAELAHVARLTTVGELVASIAHEINQPLAAAAASGSACLRWLDREQPDLDAARHAASRIVRDAHRAGEVIQGLRELVKKTGPKLTELDINRAIQDVLTLSRSDLQQEGIVLQTNLSPEVQPVFGDRVQLQQVLLNLITNAIDAMSTVTDRPKVLTITSEPADPGGILVAVEDTGPGLDPATADRIYDPFFTTKPAAMGMGLSICRSIIDAHGGRFWSSPSVPYGTAFRFTVPGVATK
jgi:PAS domain S-box-containing protein